MPQTAVGRSKDLLAELFGLETPTTDASAVNRARPFLPVGHLRCAGVRGWRGVRDVGRGTADFRAVLRLADEPEAKPLPRPWLPELVACAVATTPYSPHMADNS